MRLRQHKTMRLSFATEYPMGTLPGEAMAALTTLVQDAIGTELEIDALLTQRNRCWEHVQRQTCNSMEELSSAPL